MLVTTLVQRRVITCRSALLIFAVAMTSVLWILLYCTAGATGTAGEVAVSQAKAGNVTEAIKTVAAMEPAYKFNSYRDIALARAETNDMKGIRQIVESAQSDPVMGRLSQTYPTKISLIDLRANILDPVAHSYLKSGQIDLAQECVELIQPGLFESATNFSTNTIEIILSDIAEAQARANDVKSGIAKAQSVKNQFRRAGTLGRIAVVQAERGDISGALTTEGLIQPRTLSADGPLLVIVQALLKAGATTEATTLVKQHLEFAQGIEKEPARRALLKQLEGPKTLVGL